MRSSLFIWIQGYPCAVKKGSPAEGVVTRYVSDKKYLTCRVVLSEAEKKRIEEENRLKSIAASLQQKLASFYQDQLETSQFDLLKNVIASSITNICDKQTWTELSMRRISAIPTAINLKETSMKIASAESAEAAYDSLPEWIAAEYIKKAEDNRARLAFTRQIQALEKLARETVIPDFDSGTEKNEVLGRFLLKAKSLIGDEDSFASSLKYYDGMAELESLRWALGLGEKRLVSAEAVIGSITEKKSVIYDRLAALLEKKNADLEAIRLEEEKLKEERSHLGFFQGKRKKEIAALLEAIPSRIKQVEEKYENAKNGFR